MYRSSYELEKLVELRLAERYRERELVNMSRTASLGKGNVFSRIFSNNRLKQQLGEYNLKPNFKVVETPQKCVSC